MLVRTGVLAEETVQDVLDQQRHTLPFASLCYALGHASERTLVQMLSKQVGVPGVVLDHSVIDLAGVERFDGQWLLHQRILPVYQIDRRLFLAVDDPARVGNMVSTIEFEHDVTVVLHVGLRICLDRALRGCLAALGRGERSYRGMLAEKGATEPIFVVAEMTEPNLRTPEAAAREAVVEDVTKEVRVEELLDMEVPTTSVDEDTNDYSTARGEDSVLDQDLGTAGSTALVLDDPRQDRGGEEARAKADGPKKILIVDDDFASRHLLVKELQPEGYRTATASGGSEAVRMLKENPPSAVVLDVMLPEIDGFQICRAIKQSKRYRHIPVILMSAVIDSGKVSDRVLRQYGADAYFEKPLNTERIRARLRDLLADVDAANDAPRVRDKTFAAALELYRAGNIDGAIESLRHGIADDPLSTKHHFVLANLLQKKDLLYEAIDEYETTVELRPDYFPALTRLAYLYYKKGYAAKAIETWRRSLPHCDNDALRENIQVFMRKLIAGMQSPATPDPD
jgi:two-component system alkaline phosphatase synthesis response regulator PhoP